MFQVDDIKVSIILLLLITALLHASVPISTNCIFDMPHDSKLDISVIIIIKWHHTHEQNVYSSTTTIVSQPSVWDYLGEPVLEETFTHSHLSWSSIILYLLPPATTIHSILLVQFTCLFAQPLSKSSLVYLMVWHPPLHTPYISSPNHSLLFATQAHTNITCFVVVLRLCHLILFSHSTLYFELYNLNTTHLSDHSHLCPLKCHLIFFSHRPGLTSMQMQHTTSHTTAVQSPSHINYISPYWWAVVPTALIYSIQLKF